MCCYFIFIFIFWSHCLFNPSLCFLFYDLLFFYSFGFAVVSWRSNSRLCFYLFVFNCWDCCDWCCTCDGFYFGFVLQIVCRLEENIGFPYFFKSQQLLYQSYKSVTQSKKIQQCIFLTDIYLLVICMLCLFF